MDEQSRSRIVPGHYLNESFSDRISLLGMTLNHMALREGPNLFFSSNLYQIVDIGEYARFFGLMDEVGCIKYDSVGALIPVLNGMGTETSEFNLDYENDDQRYGSIQSRSGVIIPRPVLKVEPSIEHNSYSFPDNFIIVGSEPNLEHLPFYNPKR